MEEPKFWMSADVNMEARTVRVRIVGNRAFLEHIGNAILQVAQGARGESSVEWKGPEGQMTVTYHPLATAHVTANPGTPPAAVPPPTGKLN